MPENISDAFRDELGFWSKLPKPFFVLAPMADVTDAAFRRVIAKYGKPDVIWTEFVSVSGLLSPGREILKRDLEYTESERPIVAQIFGNDPAQFRDVASMLFELGFDGIDINMGCPDRNVEKQGGGASLIKDPKRAQEIIQATKDGATKNGKRLPVSVKTRIGYNRVEIETWLPALLEVAPAALTVHARTRKEMSLVPARWEFVAEAVKLRDIYSPQTKLIGNGDVRNLSEAQQRIGETNADGIMIGRGIFGTPWLFNKNLSKFNLERFGTESEEISLTDKFSVLIEHTKLFEELLGDIKNFAIMKKHYKAYVHGFDGAKELRAELMETENATQVEEIIHTWLATHKQIPV